MGRIQRTNLEGGAWTFVTNQGVVYQLKGGGPDLFVEGMAAEIEGRVASNLVGITMMGDVLEVTRYRLLS
jgi:hypothetical protein